MPRTVFLVLLFMAAPVAVADPAARAIYRCETASGVTFADRPCGAASETYEPNLGTVSVMTTVKAAPVATRPSPERSPARTQSKSDNKAEVCDRIEQSLRKIASTMRTGYKASQGERLKERKRELEDRRRAQRC